MKSFAILLVAAAAGAIGSTALRPTCGRPGTTMARVATPAAVVASVPMPPKIASVSMPAASAPGRNVFAYNVGQARVPVLHREDEKTATATATVTVTTTTAVVQPPDPPPAYDYLGAFGPQDYPILVYKKNGDVVNVAVRKP